MTLKNAHDKRPFRAFSMLQIDELQIISLIKHKLITRTKKSRRNTSYSVPSYTKTLLKRKSLATAKLAYFRLSKVALDMKVNGL